MKRYVVVWVPGKGKIDVAPEDAESEAWVAEPAVTHAFEEVFRDMKSANPLVASDPAPGEAPSPAGIMTPSLLAAALQSRLRDRFPYEEVTVRAESVPRIP